MGRGYACSAGEINLAKGREDGGVCGGVVNLLCVHRPNSLKIWGLMAMFVASKQR